jgi:hypothetical protein
MAMGSIPLVSRLRAYYSLKIKAKTPIQKSTHNQTLPNDRHQPDNAFVIVYTPKMQEMSNKTQRFCIAKIVESQKAGTRLCKDFALFILYIFRTFRYSAFESATRQRT